MSQDLVWQEMHSTRCSSMWSNISLADPKVVSIAVRKWAPSRWTLDIHRFGSCLLRNQWTSEALVNVQLPVPSCKGFQCFFFFFFAAEPKEKKKSLEPLTAGVFVLPPSHDNLTAAYERCMDGSASWRWKARHLLEWWNSGGTEVFVNQRMVESWAVVSGTFLYGA